MDDLHTRFEAVERAMSDGDSDAPADGTATVERLDRLEDELVDLSDRVDEVAAATQALRGYAGNVQSVNKTVEKRADAALAAVEALEDRFEGPDGRLDGGASARERAASPEPQSCEACGRPGCRHGSGPDDRLTAGAGASRESLGDVDTAAGGPPVRVDRDHRRDREEDRAGVVERFRDLL